jgi:outer membrane protein assembly factor BamD
MRKPLLLCLILCFAVVSCSHKKAEVKKVDSPGNLYIEGIAFMKKKQYDKAITSFGKVRENFPFDPIALVAQIKQADAQFAKKAYAVAAAIYEDFVNSYPEDENAAYALRRLAECYEKLSPASDREQANTFKAVERFTFLKNRYPKSPYAKDADVRMLSLTRKLAARELYVGEFYYKWERYNASIFRLEYFLEKYPEATGRDKALYLLAQDWRELHNPEKAQAYLDRLRREFPKSIYVGQKKKERKGKSLLVAGAGAAPTGSVSGAGPSVPTADFSYSEKQAREIDLRPAQPPAREGGAQGAASGKENQGEAAAGQKPADDPANTGQPRAEKTVGTAAGQEASPAAGVYAGAESSNTKGAAIGAGGGPTDEKAAATKDGETDQAKNTGGKKDSLGFFTEKKPVDVVADTMEGLEKGKIVVFKGNVIAKQVDLYLFSDMLTAYMNEETNEIERAKAEGNVKIVKLDRTATCKEAFFYNDKGEIILKGDVVVFSAKDKVSGDIVTYYVNEDRVYVQGEKDKRAKAIISPK